ncbi:hypothetical protein BJ138DRAFT_1113986 [Hygrophoropsis aurantiaca]|uniref:Uncharacterized protein n=1 Tax=Hygrophoropsis aurantiaca TaxID=72124 RepID=A0ACB8ABQ7_9AGAM|nr:hypothetical protein BJ138DRAFT_1113986 [Hygrophoropsis aurantiaca]
MWSKLSHALKRSDEGGDSASASASTDVLSRVYEQHPNLSVFHNVHDENDIHEHTEQRPPSPPSSPSKKRSMLKRMSKVGDDSGSLRLIPKKVKSHLHLRSNPSQASLPRISTDTARPSLDSITTPATATGSVRSILRDPKTPGTGQNVRFFSRDAYKPVAPSPDTSMEPDPLSFADRLNKANIEHVPSSRPTVMELFSPPPLKDDASSFMAPFPPPLDMSNLFDMSQEHDLPIIPHGLKTPLLDSAIELDDTEVLSKNHSTPLKPPHDRSISFSFGQTVFHSMPKASDPSPDSSMEHDADASQKKPNQNRNRALSDTVFQSMIKAAKQSHPEADINDMSSPSLLVSPEPDPFRANATTYYTPQTMIPPTPPQGAPAHTRSASREEDLIWSLRTQLALQQELNAQYEIDLSARDELVRTLETRLDAAERENEKRRGVLRGWKKKAAELDKMCRRLEEQVEEGRMESVERSVMDEASGEALRQLHRQISQLEREKGDLEAKVEDRVKQEVEAQIVERVKEMDAEIHEMKESLRRKEESEKALKAGIKEAKEQMGAMVFADGDQRLSWAGEKSGLEREKEELIVALETAQSELDAARSQLEEAQSELTSTHSELATARSEHAVLQSELEAQWSLTERHGEEQKRLQAEALERAAEADTLKIEVEGQKATSNALKAEVEALRTEIHTLEEEAETLHAEAHERTAEIQQLEEKITGMEEEWNETENHKADIEAELQEVADARDVAERERDELNTQLQDEQEHAADLTQALQERESQLTSLESKVTSADSERQFALENVSRLESNIKERDAEIQSLSSRVRSREAEAEALREELSTLRREYTRLLNEHEREVEDARSQSTSAHSQLEDLLKEKAQSDMSLGSSQEQVHALKEEVERLRRQVHELQQASADKEVVIMQLTKRSVRDREDLSGLNIALDSKQQELELVKRRLGVRGTGGSTPAQPSKVASRRDSSIFATPSTGGSRPPSAMSDTGSERKAGADSGSERKDSAPRASAAALGKSVRMNLGTSVSGTGKMGPPATKVSRPSMGLGGTPTPAPGRIPSTLGLRRASSASANNITGGTGSVNGTPIGTKTAGKTPIKRPSAPSSLNQSQTRTPVQGRRISVSSSVLSEVDEKENVMTTPKNAVPA